MYSSTQNQARACESHQILSKHSLSPFGALPNEWQSVDYDQ